MERLTERISGYAHGAEGVSADRLTGNYYRGEFESTACIDRLAEYEDLEEQGRLLRLPCAVGDTVYAFHMAKVIEFKVIKISWFTMDRENIINAEYLNTDCDCFRNFIKEEFGKTVFLTKEEAEAALKEL